MVKTFEFKFSDKGNALPEGFWSAVDVWIKKPHVVNKRLCGVIQTEDRDVDVGEFKDFLSKLTQCGTDELSEVVSFLDSGTDHDKGHLINRQLSLTVRTIIPKVNTYGTHAHKEIILKDVGRQRVFFVPIEQEDGDSHLLKKSNMYQIQLHGVTDEDWMLSLHVPHPEEWLSNGVAYPKLPWLDSELLPKLARWATESRSSEFKSTLSLISVQKYSLQYQQLKDKYKEMVKVWPEVTDPEKFVYEDVAIATYLLVMWDEERAEKGLTGKQSFVDLGCGNGLLVHILTNEGHPGKGIDVRKRKIWDMYGSETHLEEAAISPGEGCLFPHADWLIGNHSDELTPWIPLIAARSSFSCRYFVLPCCFFDFFGKYQRRQCKKSQYKEYIEFIAEVSTQCGFDTEEDCLRIPSTKRVCLVGKSRRYAASEESLAEEWRRNLLKSRQCPPSAPPGEHHLHGDGDGQEEGGCHDAWGSGGFQPRERTEVVRNCGGLPREFVDGVVLHVANTLLGLTKEEKEEEEEEKKSDKDTWNTGGSLAVREVAELLEASVLQRLKKECGGLQTLLKNNHQVFRVEGGRVYIRDWRAAVLSGGVAARRDAKRKPPPPEGALKTRPCWFHAHHPRGCPLSTERCPFAHGHADLRPSTRPIKKPRH
ncbi:probable tRNA (uracil-O(2)-)-methyltransferase isoform X1 [Alosa alosa]|uniref:probable tRNA (uracil-O(2)-)-methyltransferase isoform X1 n=1 Tax=Alosa alosa TaxID=278164 RepID=UPI0020153AA1|nr:probable tRNA (uracil-O(2)-)-methyltransferase isoform X1 [Alosa alosa]